MKRQNDFGFGNQTGKLQNNRRRLNKDGSFNILRRGIGQLELDFYQELILMSWTRFFIVLLLFYAMVNSLFALLYMAVGIENLSGAVEDERMSSFWDAFYFSVQTLTTVGYGSLSPQGFETNLVAALGAFTGLLSFALATGLLFARFSRPNAKILFSEKAIIAPYKDDRKSFQLRIVNKRRNILTDIRASLMITWTEDNRQHYGHLKLEQDFLHFFPLNWTIVHPINKDSPLYNWTAETMTQNRAEFLVVIQGYDDTFSNKVRTQSSYYWNEIAWNKRFVPMYYINEEGYTVLEIGKLSRLSAA